MGRNEKKYGVLLKKLYTRGTISLLFFSIVAFFLYIPHAIDYFSRSKTLNVYAFTEMIAPAVIEKFERQTGVCVNIKYFQTNEELYAKLRINQGDGYDIIVASDYMMRILREEKILQKIDCSKIKSYQELDEKLLHQHFDPDNNHSLPLAWCTYGMVYDKKLFAQPVQDLSLNYLFQDPQALHRAGLVTAPYRVCMVDDAKEAVMYAQFYLYEQLKQLNHKEFKTIENLLIGQKKWIESYTSSSLQYYLFSGIAQIAITSSSYMRKILEHTDAFGFKVPKEGSILVIESLAIPLRCKKTELAHHFIDFVLSASSSSSSSSLYGYNPTNKQAYASIRKEFLENPNIFPDAETFARLHMTQGDLPKKMVENIWLGVKFA